MKSPLLLLTASVLLGISPPPANARPVDLSTPTGGLGAASPKGYAEHWLELGEIDFGEGVSLPLRLWFDSGRDGDTKDLGNAWWRAPVLHSRMLAKDGEKWPCMLLCGKMLYLYRRPDQAETWASADGEWVGTMKEKNFVVAREDGWTMEFLPDGNINALLTDSGRLLRWNRAATGVVLSITGEKAAAPGAEPVIITGLNVVRDPASGLVTALQPLTAHGAKSYGLTFDAERRLSSVAFPDKTTESYTYGHDAEGDPSLAIINRSKRHDALVWDKTRHTLRSDGVWVYSINFSANHFFPAFTRLGPGGEVEHYENDRESGTVVFVSANGYATVTKKVTAIGPAKDKTKAVVRVLPGGTDAAVLYRALYDQATGQLVDETDALGRVTHHEWVLWGNTPQSGVRTHSIISALGHRSVTEFDRHGDLVASTDPLGNVTKHAYDNQHRLLTSTGPDGNVTESLTYTSAGKLSSRTDAAGNTTSYTYDAAGHRATTKDALGNITKEEHDERGNLVNKTDALGRTWRYQYNSSSQLVQATDPEGNVSETHAYDKRGRRVSTTDAAGNSSKITYDAFDRIISRTDPAGDTTSYVYEVKDGSTGCRTCGSGSQATLITMPSGRKISRTYDADHHLLTETTAYGTPQAATTRQSYDLVGNLLSSTDPLDRTTRFEYDAENRRTRMIHPDDTFRLTAYDAAGQAIAETDELGHVSKRSYDAYGNLISSTDPAGNTSTRLYDRPADAAIHRPSGTRSAGGVTTWVQHDALGRRIAQINGEGTDLASALQNQDSSITRHTYDAVGNEIETTDPTGKVTRHAYDALNRRVTTTDALGRVWKYSYASNAGASGNPPCCGADPTANARAQTVTFPDGTTETRITDAVGRVVETKDAKGDSVKYGYDPDGRLLTLTDARGNTTRWTYDPYGKLESKVYPDRTAEFYEHDAAGQLLTKTRPDGTAAVHTYDKRGHLLSVRWKDNKSEPIDYSYDAAGHLLTARNDSASIARRYTASGKIESEEQKITTPLGLPEDQARKADAVYKVGYGYDPDGRIASITYPEGNQLAYRYTNHGELVEVTETQAGADKPKPRTIATYTRRPNGQVSELLLANGVKTVKTYDGAGRLEKISHIAPDGKELFSETSKYDQRDRRTARLKGDGTADLFAYDPAGQVTAAAYGQALPGNAEVPTLQPPSAKPTNPEPGTPNITPQQKFAYDPAGNRKEFQDIDGTKTTYQTNEANQYTQLSVPSASSVVDVQPDYDKNGNLLKDPKNTYTWDADIHLMAVETKSSIKDQASSITKFKYDPLHRRVARLESNGTLTHFVHDGWNVIAEYSTSSPKLPVSKTPRLVLLWGEDLSRSLQGAGGIGGLLLTRRPPPQVSNGAISNQGPSASHFHYDSNGNVILLTDAAASATAHYQYDAFGRIIVAFGPAAESNHYRFSTKPIEDTSGLAFYGFRYYMPTLGRWPSRDAIGENGGINIYAMTQNNPLAAYDILGKMFGLPIVFAGPPCLMLDGSAGYCIVAMTITPARCPRHPVDLAECMAVADMGMVAACAEQDHAGYTAMCQNLADCLRDYY